MIFLGMIWLLQTSLTKELGRWKWTNWTKDRYIQRICAKVIKENLWGNDQFSIKSEMGTLFKFAHVEGLVRIIFTTYDRHDPYRNLSCHIPREIRAPLKVTDSRCPSNMRKPTRMRLAWFRGLGGMIVKSKLASSIRILEITSNCPPNSKSHCIQVCDFSFFHTMWLLPFLIVFVAFSIVP